MINKRRVILILALTAVLSTLILALYEEKKPSCVEAQTCQPAFYGGGFYTRTGNNSGCGKTTAPCMVGNPMNGGACGCPAGYSVWVTSYCGGYPGANNFFICYRL